MMALPTLHVKSLSDFVRRVVRQREAWQSEDDSEAEKCGNDHERTQTWFRGQANARWRLVPKLYRSKNADEAEIFTEFKLRALQLMTGREPATEKEWYF